jgi:four helix bundle protein
MARSYKDLDIYNESLSLYFDIQKMTLQTPKHELYELGSQLRRAADSTVSNIVEGYGRRRYKAEFIRFLTFSPTSIFKGNCHLEKTMNIYPEL